MASAARVRPYGGQASLYDREYSDFDSDVNFYIERLRLERVRGPVIELGSGTGRVAIPLVKAGYPVVGIDLSDEMLNQARRRRRLLSPELAMQLRYRKQDMATFTVRGTYQAVLIPFSGLGLLLDMESRASCLDHCHSAMSDGGLLLVDQFVPKEKITGAAGQHSFKRSFPARYYGEIIEKETIETTRPDGGLDDVIYRYSRVRQSDGVVLEGFDVVFSIARLTVEDVVSLTESHGFVVENVFGDYRGGPLTPKSSRFILDARKV